MKSRLVNVTHRKRGASWPDGTPWMCIRCNGRRRRAKHTADRKYADGGVLPVGYCDEHWETT